MQALKPYTLTINAAFNEAELAAGVYLAILHATRIPPHIGMIAGGAYHSLSIKGQELNVPVQALIRNNTLRRIASLYIRIKPHKELSDQQLKENFIGNIQQFPKVEVGKATCLSPVKLFFEESYGVPMADVNYIFELLPRLESQDLMEASTALFIEDVHVQLPVYDLGEINKNIAQAEKEAKKITKGGKS